MVTGKTARLIQIVLFLLVIAAAVRVVIIMRSRSRAPAERASAAAPPLNREAYVVPKKLHISSLKSAQQLTTMPVWVQEGYRYAAYPYEHHNVDFKQRAGMLLPLQKIQIKEIATAANGDEPDRQVLAVFDEGGKTYAVPIGVESGKDVTVYADEMFFYEDPHDLYAFWPNEVWDAIEKHEPQKGMNEFQVAFAIGMGIPEPGGGVSRKTVKYPNGGKPLVITYQNGHAVDIKPLR